MEAALSRLPETANAVALCLYELPFVILSTLAMTFRFRTFRQLLSGLIVLLSSICICLSLSLLRAFKPPAVAWLVISIQTVSILRALFSIVRRPLLKETQSVASEVIWLFILFPFHLMLTLLIITPPFFPAAISSSYIPLVLQSFVLFDATVHLFYATGTIFVAILTVPAFDRDVWIRDIDASPSPFPIRVLLAFYLPCCCSLTPSGNDAEDSLMMSSVLCLPGCNCTTKMHTLATEQSSETTLPAPRGGILSGHKSSGSLSQALVRIPNAAERRSSITIAFEV